jgi:endonuclease YncB( thermonuclease family)
MSLPPLRSNDIPLRARKRWALAFAAAPVFGVGLLLGGALDGVGDPLQPTPMTAEERVAARLAARPPAEPRPTGPVVASAVTLDASPETTGSLGASAPAGAAELLRDVEVVDARTLRFRGRDVRLSGIEPPSPERRCAGGEEPSGSCAERAVRQLRAFLSGRTVSCRAAAGAHACRSGGADLAEWLVRRGLVTPDEASSERFAAAVAHARSHRLGLWREARGRVAQAR